MTLSTLAQQSPRRSASPRFGPAGSGLLAHTEPTWTEPAEATEAEEHSTPERQIRYFGDVVGAQAAFRTHAPRLAKPYRRDAVVRRPGPRLADAAAITYLPSEPASTLGARLRAIRERAIAKGMRLLTAEEIIAEVARMRGER